MLREIAACARKLGSMKQKNVMEEETYFPAFLSTLVRDKLAVSLSRRRSHVQQYKRRLSKESE